jgi:hypothetical protein
MNKRSVNISIKDELTYLLEFYDDLQLSFTHPVSASESYAARRDLFFVIDDWLQTGAVPKNATFIAHK